MRAASWFWASALIALAAACGETAEPVPGGDGDGDSGGEEDVPDSGTADAGDGRDASGDPDAGRGPVIDPRPDPDSELSISCVSELAERPSTIEHGQRYRFSVPLDRRTTVRIHRGDVNLFAGDELTARSYASTEGEALGSSIVERELFAELEHNGDITVTWSDGQVELGRLFAWGMLQGPGSFAGDRRTVLCWRSDLELPYRYEPASGQCVNEHGSVGRHVFPLLYVHETGNGECNDFRDVEISTLGWPIYAGWNLRGADLSAAGIHFATLPDADLSGADLSVLNVGYFGGRGRVDAHTKLPDGFEPDGDGMFSFGDGPLAADYPYYAWLYPCEERPLATGCRNLP